MRIELPGADVRRQALAKFVVAMRAVLKATLGMNAELGPGGTAAEWEGAAQLPELRRAVGELAPRLRDPGVLVKAVQDGLALLSWQRESFAHADSYDEATKR